MALALAGVVACTWADEAAAGDVSDVNDPCEAHQVVTAWAKDKVGEVVPDPVYANSGNVVRFQNLTEKEMVVSFVNAAGTLESPFESAVVFVVPAHSAVCWTVKSPIDFPKDEQGNDLDKAFEYTVTGEQVTARPRIIVKPTSTEQAVK